MITIVAKTVVIESEIETFINLANELITESKKEAGCREYNLYQDTENKNVLTFIEKWEDEEAIKLHNESAHFTSIVPKLGEMQVKDTEVNLYKQL
ncbi:MAG: antibiotic biosynthesis monooxygenase [Vallitalea sp.]|nr:antibiotic biosynthesis monooxygenase [Vallitalea sp.]